MRKPSTRGRGRRICTLGGAAPVAVQSFLDLLWGHAHVNAGALFLQQHSDAGITLTPATVESFGELFQSQVSEPHGYVELPPHFRGQEHVLAGQAQREVWRIKMAWQEVLRQAVEGLSPTESPLAHGLPQHQWVNAGFNPHTKRLSHGRLDNIASTVMDQLGNGPGTDRPHVIGLVPNGIEHVFILIVNCSVTADPDRQPSAAGPTWPPTDWSVEDVRAHLGKHLMNAANQRRRVGT